MKDLKISKELIKAVLQKETETLSKDFNFITNEDYIEFSDDGEMQFEYCIYKFAFKCKEWARDKYDITVSSSIYKKYAKAWDIPNDKSYIADTEVEAIIKACEWVLKEINEKGIESNKEKI